MSGLDSVTNLLSCGGLTCLFNPTGRNNREVATRVTCNFTCGIIGKWLQESHVISHSKPLLLRWLFLEEERSEREILVLCFLCLAKPYLIWFYNHLNM